MNFGDSTLIAHAKEHGESETADIGRVTGVGPARIVTIRAGGRQDPHPI